MTPMNKIKTQIDKLKSFLGEDFVEVNLNKSAPKEGIDYGYSVDYAKTGVASDFIKMIKIKNKENLYSLGFVFDYINLTETEQKISYSLKIETPKKKSGDFFTSKKFSVEEFKEKINFINKEIEEMEQPKQIMDIINIINKNLLDKPPRIAIAMKPRKK